MHYNYKLQKYSGRSSRHTCPSCGQPRCFALYVDENGNAIAPEVGKCDHLNRCGYHLTPREYFAQHSDNKPRRQVLNYVSPALSTSTVDYIPMPLIERSIGVNNTLMDYLGKHYNAKQLKDVTEAYKLGSTKERAIIYPQIDKQGRCRTGKIMKYDTSGHRLKGSLGDAVDWLHSRLMKQQGKTSADYTLRQCLFGEHLLAERNGDTVCLVEGEKTAVICAIEMPQFVWLSCGGVQGLTSERCAVLSGCCVMLFPDIDAIPAWRAKMQQIEKICRVVQLSDWAAKAGYPTPDCEGWEHCSPKFDIADHILGEKARSTVGDVCDWLNGAGISPNRATVNLCS